MSKLREAVRTSIVCSTMLSAACGSRPAPPAGASVPTHVKPAPPADDAADARLAAALLRPFGESSVEAAIEALARAGVATYADDDSTVLQQPSGASPSRYYRSQARNMALLLSAHQGTGGADLDRLAPSIALGGRSLPMSAVLAAYVAEAPTFAAKLSRKLIGTVDVRRHAEHQYPTIVLALFLADTLPAAQRHASRARPPLMLAGFGAAPAADPCGAAEEAMGSAAASIGAASGSSLLFGLIGSAAGTLLNLDAAAVRSLLPSAPVPEPARPGIAALNTFVQLQSLLKTWTLEIVAEPDSVSYLNHGTPIDGAFRVRIVGAESGAWPVSVKQCADRAFQLPAAPSAAETTAVWGTSFSDHAVETHRDERVGADSVARLTYRAATESPRTHDAGGDVTQAPIGVSVMLRNESKANLQAITTRLSPSGRAFAPTDAQLDAMDQLIEPTADGSAAVLYHRRRLQARATLIRGGVTLRAFTCDGVEGPWSYVVHNIGVGATSGRFVVPGPYSWSMLGRSGYASRGTVALTNGKLIFSGASGNAFTVPIAYGVIPECRVTQTSRR